MKTLSLSLLLCLCGCAIHESKETVTVQGPTVTITLESKVWGGSLLSFFKVRQVSKTGPLSELFIGDMESKPDAEAIEAFSQGLIKGFLKGM